jgi:hypothetical protein
MKSLRKSRSEGGKGGVERVNRTESAALAGVSEGTIAYRVKRIRSANRVADGA